MGAGYFQPLVFFGKPQYPIWFRQLACLHKCAMLKRLMLKCFVVVTVKQMDLFRVSDRRLLLCIVSICALVIVSVICACSLRDLLSVVIVHIFMNINTIFNNEHNLTVNHSVNHSVWSIQSLWQSHKSRLLSRVQINQSWALTTVLLPARLSNHKQY